MYKKFKFPKSIKFNDVFFEGNIFIGERTYINDGGRIDSGKNSKVKIGSDCAIGRYVHITAKTHGFERPTSDDENSHPAEIEADTMVGNGVWIGDFVFIAHGITIGHHAIIGTHSFVNRDVLPFEIVGGSPIRHIKFNEKHSEYLNKK